MTVDSTSHTTQCTPVLPLGVSLLSVRFWLDSTSEHGCPAVIKDHIGDAANAQPGRYL
jgi:hypothetical protein